MSPQFWVVDDGPLGKLAGIVDSNSVSNWPTGRLLVAQQTFVDAALSPDREALVNATTGDGQPIFGRAAVRVPSIASDILYNHLRRYHNNTTTNLAECQVISWILAEDADAVFVAQDKTAVTLALSELGRCRVSISYEFYDWLLADGLITKQNFSDLCEQTRKSFQAVPIPWRTATAQGGN